MSFTNSNDYITGRKPAVYPAGCEVVAMRFPLSLATADLALNVIGQVGVLPAGCVPVALIVDSDDMDSNGTPTLAMSIGVLNTAGTALSTATDDGGAVWATGVVISEMGGMAFANSAALQRVNQTQADRKIGILVSTASATAVAGVIGVTLLYRAA